MEDINSIYKNEELKRRCMFLYENALRHWPIPFEEINEKTNFGTTHIIACGNKQSPPLLLLHGQWATATMWSSMIRDLSKNHRVYAIDQIDDIGKSILTRKIIDRADYGRWLLEVLSNLGIEDTSIIGLSYGGYLAAYLATIAPEKVNRLCLLCPGLPLLGSPMKEWAFHGMPMILFPTRKTAEWLVQGMSIYGYQKGNLEQEQLIEGILCLRSRIPIRPTIQPEELSSFHMPVLLLIGEKETMYEPFTAITRARQFVPHIQAELIPNAGHMLNTDQPALVLERIINFINV
jgi:pimeloyl-ACP methyl ester carboxylesterase